MLRRFFKIMFHAGHHKHAANTRLRLLLNSFPTCVGSSWAPATAPKPRQTAYNVWTFPRCMWLTTPDIT